MKLEKALEIVDEVLVDYGQIQDYPKSNWTKAKQKMLQTAWNKINADLNWALSAKENKKCSCC